MAYSVDESEGLNDSKRFHMYRTLCDLDSVRDQADGEPQRVAGAARSSFAKATEDEWAGGDFVLEVILQGRVRAVHRMGVGEFVT